MMMARVSFYGPTCHFMWHVLIRNVYAETKRKISNNVNRNKILPAWEKKRIAQIYSSQILGCVLKSFQKKAFETSIKA